MESFTLRQALNFFFRKATVTIALPRCLNTSFVSSRSMAGVVSRGRPPPESSLASPSQSTPPLSSQSWMQCQMPCCVGFSPSGFLTVAAIVSKCVPAKCRPYAIPLAYGERRVRVTCFLALLFASFGMADELARRHALKVIDLSARRCITHYLNPPSR